LSMMLLWLQPVSARSMTAAAKVRGRKFGMMEIL
jgi:hypothetical protein